MKTILAFAVLCIGLLPNAGFAHGKPGDLPDSVMVGGCRGGKSDREKLAEKMSEIIIPALKFENAALNQVLAVLEKESIEGDPDGEGVNFVAVLSEGLDPSMSLNLRRISLLDAIRMVCLKSGTRYSTENNTVIISDIESTAMIIRIYPFHPNLSEIFSITNGPTSSLMPVTDTFEKMGIAFPTGASVSYNPVVSSLIIRNTRENLEVFEKLLSQINVIPLQVQYSLTLAELSGVKLAASTNGIALTGTHLAHISDAQKTVLHTAGLVGMTGKQVVYEYKDTASSKLGATAKTISFKVHPIVAPDGYTVLTKIEGQLEVADFEAELKTMVTQWDHGSLILVLSSSSEKSKYGGSQQKALVLELHVAVIDPNGEYFHKTNRISLEEEKALDENK